jgi:hypothetical protein
VRSDTSTNHTRSNSDARLRVALPSALVQQLQAIAAADSLTLSSTARRLLSRAVARELRRPSLLAPSAGREGMTDA